MLAAAPDPRHRIALGVRHGAVHAHLHELAVSENRVERRAQLVTHDGQELTLRATRSLGIAPRCLALAIEPRIVHGNGGALRHLPGERHILGVDTVARDR